MKIFSLVVAMAAVAAFTSPASAYSCGGGGERPQQSTPGAGA